MRLVSSSLRFSCVALLIPASLARAYPNSYTPRGSNEIELFEYPPSPIATIELGKEKITPSEDEDSPAIVSYDVEWVGPTMIWEPATATKVEEEEYESLVRWQQIMGNFLAAGQDKDKQLWVVTKPEDEPEKETSELGEDAGGY